MKVLNTYVPCVPDFSGYGMSYIAVLTCGHCNDHKVYVGMAILPDPSSNMYDTIRNLAADRIAQNGMQVPFEIAKAYFPFIKENEYRA